MSDESYTESDVRENVWQIVQRNWDNVSVPLGDWQVSQLSALDSEAGISCLLRMWFLIQNKLSPGTFCNATWDGHYCWPPTTSGSVVSRQCKEAFEESQPFYAPHLEVIFAPVTAFLFKFGCIPGNAAYQEYYPTGTAFRVCQSNGSWLWGNWTNYSECADSYEAYVEKSTLLAEEERKLVTQVQYILFIGSILSLICLLSAISIFCCFKSLWCDRVTIHIHLMAALTLRYLLLYIITEAFVLERTTHYRDVDWICKSVLIVYLYATVTSVNWMFIQGVYLNGKLTTNVFDKAAPFKLYYTFAWLSPVPLLTIYAVVMETNHPVKCWKGYSDMDEIWIIVGPIIVALVINLALLINILRILVTKAHRNGLSSDAARCFRRAAKATLILSPILGINNLLFVYNPGGVYNKYYVILNSIFGSTQGVFVAFIYCYLSSEVHSAIRRCYRRFLARRDAIRRIQRQRTNSTSTSSGIIMENPVHFWRNGNTCCRSISSRQAFSSLNSTLASVHTIRTDSITSGNSTDGGRFSRGSSIQRFCPISKFTSGKNDRSGCCAKHKHHAVFISRRSNGTVIETVPATRVVRDQGNNTAGNDVIIPLSELVRG